MANTNERVVLHGDAGDIIMEDPDNEVLITPYGYAVEVRKKGLCLLCSGSCIQHHVKRLRERVDVRETKRSSDGLWEVEIAYGKGIEAAEYGVHAEKAIAYRYALGAHYGGYEDAKLPRQARSKDKECETNSLLKKLVDSIQIDDGRDPESVAVMGNISRELASKIWPEEIQRRQVVEMWTSDFAKQALQEGWLVSTGSDGNRCIERVDAPADWSQLDYNSPQFGSDEAAVHFVAERVQQGSPVAKQAFMQVLGTQQGNFILSMLANK